MKGILQTALLFGLVLTFCTFSMGQYPERKLRLRSVPTRGTDWGVEISFQAGLPLEQVRDALELHRIAIAGKSFPAGRNGYYWSSVISQADFLAVPDKSPVSLDAIGVVGILDKSRLDKPELALDPVLTVLGFNQSKAAQPTHHGPDLGPLRRLRGEVIAESTAQKPVGELHVRSVTLEKVPIVPPLQLAGGITSNYAYNLVVEGGPFPLFCTIRIGDQMFQAIQVDEDRTVAQFLAAPHFEEGLEIRVLGMVQGQVVESLLPEKLSLPREFQLHVPKNRITLRSVGLMRGGNKREVKIVVQTDLPAPIRNEVLVFQIGPKEYLGAAFDPKQPFAYIPEDEFYSLPDNAQVILKFGFGAPGGSVAGHLDKSMLDK